MINDLFNVPREIISQSFKPEAPAIFYCIVICYAQAKFNYEARDPREISIKVSKDKNYVIKDMLKWNISNHLYVILLK